jgi:hypothetical protein
VSANGEVHFAMSGLPHQAATGRYLAALASILIIIGFVAWSFRGENANASSFERLEAKRKHLLAELAALNEKATTDKQRKRREELIEELTRLYKEIDEASA